MPSAPPLSAARSAACFEAGFCLALGLPARITATLAGLRSRRHSLGLASLNALVTLLAFFEAMGRSRTAAPGVCVRMRASGAHQLAAWRTGCAHEAYFQMLR